MISRVRKVYCRPQISTSEIVLNTLASNFHTELENRIETSFLVDILNDFAPVERRILQMFIYDGMSHSEISEKLKIPLGTVKTKIRRRLDRIRQQVSATENRSGTEASFSTA